MSRDRISFEPEIFLDRTHGKRMGEVLRRADFKVQPIFEVYPGIQHEGISDPEWIKLCGEKGWIAVSGDKRLETAPENRQAVIEAKAKVFVLTDSNSPPEVWAAAIIIGHYRMLDYIDNDGPFFVSIGKRSDGHVSRLRLPPGYVPPEPETVPHVYEVNSQTLELTSPSEEEVK